MAIFLTRKWTKHENARKHFRIKQNGRRQLLDAQSINTERASLTLQNNRRTSLSIAASITLSSSEEKWKRSSQLWSNLSSYTNEAQKTFWGLQRDSNPWPPRYRCDALPTSYQWSLAGSRSGETECIWSLSYTLTYQVQLTTSSVMLLLSSWTMAKYLAVIWRFVVLCLYNKTSQLLSFWVRV